MTTFYCLRIKTPPNWIARSPYLYPPGTGWPSYTPRHWVPFSSPPTTHRATLEVFNPASTQGWSIIISIDQKLMYSIWCRLSGFSSTYLMVYSKPVVPEVGFTAPWGGGGGAVRGKRWQGALEVSPLEHIVCLFTVEVTSDQTLGNWYCFIKPIHCIKNLLTVR
jgi:hypothetical protein